MRGSNIITINGQPYDALTGMPLPKSAYAQPSSAPVPTPAQAPVPAPAPVRSTDGMQRTVRTAATAVHGRPQKSKTLMRSVLKAPHASALPKQPVKRSSQIRRFSQPQPSSLHVRPRETEIVNLRQAAQPVSPAPAVRQTEAIRPSQPRQPHAIQTQQPHPVRAAVAAPQQAPVSRQSVATPAAHQHAPQGQPTGQHKAAHPAVAAAQPTRPAPLQGSELKEALIKEQLRHVDVEQQPVAHKKQRRHPRLASIVAGVSAIVLLGGYLTYLNLPSLSIKVAAAQAGFAATYPSYQPSGYSFNGPVAYSPGEVKVRFKSNTNQYAYSLVQKASSWDSQAVLDNFVVKQSREYATLQERGLTIYLYDNKATWVNGGVLYTIDGNAPLSSEQIQKIASSTL
ncbi:hypothetical protein JNJ66_04585 [Candidatus Saccharibacteria bacterium]|nr:hypothetical protein [Candidatus Saccharibacteria bacterium]